MSACMSKTRVLFYQTMHDTKQTKRRHACSKRCQKGNNGSCLWFLLSFIHQLVLFFVVFHSSCRLRSIFFVLQTSPLSRPTQFDPTFDPSGAYKTYSRCSQSMSHPTQQQQLKPRQSTHEPQTKSTCPPRTKCATTFLPLTFLSSLTVLDSFARSAPPLSNGTPSEGTGTALPAVALEALLCKEVSGA